MHYIGIHYDKKKTVLPFKQKKKWKKYSCRSFKTFMYIYSGIEVFVPQTFSNNFHATISVTDML